MNVYVCMYMRTYVCVCVCMHYASMYVHVYVRIKFVYVWMYVSIMCLLVFHTAHLKTTYVFQACRHGGVRGVQTNRPTGG